MCRDRSSQTSARARHSHDVSYPSCARGMDPGQRGREGGGCQARVDGRGGRISDTCSRRTWPRAHALSSRPCSCRPPARGFRSTKRLSVTERVSVAANLVERLGENGSPINVRATLFHVGKVGLVRLDLGRCRWIFAIWSGGKSAPRAIPLLGNGCIGSKTGPRLVTA